MKQRLSWALHLAEVGHLASMREVLLEVWREAPCAEIATLLGERSADEPGWMELVQKAGGLRRLLEVEPFLKLLRPMGRDPRKTRLLLAVARLDLAAAPVTVNKLAEAFAVNADPAAREQLRVLAQLKIGREAEVWSALADRLSPAPLPPADALALLERLSGAVALHPALAAVYAEPHRADLRSVFADQLIERDDPWGELVNLQCAAVSDPREDALLSELAPRLREPLAPVRARVVKTQLGFPLKVSIDLSVPAEGQPLGAAWRTVKEITVEDKGWATGWSGLLADPNLAGLAVLRAAPLELLIGAETLPALERLSVVRAGFTPQAMRGHLAALVRKVPTLRQLEVDQPSHEPGVLKDWVDGPQLVVRTQLWSAHWSSTHLTFELKFPPVRSAVLALEAIAAEQPRLEVELRVRKSLLVGNEAPLQGAMAKFATAGRIIAI